MINDLVTQSNNLTALLNKADEALSLRRSKVNDGDRVWYPITNDIEFNQSENTAQDIVFNIPADCDYIAQRLSFYPYYKFVTTDPVANGVDELVFRPGVFTSQMNLFDIFISVDCLLFLTETYEKNGERLTRELQNLPFNVSMTYSGAINGRSVRGSPIDTFQYPSGMMFDEDYFLPAKSALNVKITPTFSSVRRNGIADPTLQNRYKIVGVLEGFKKVHAFK